jgi:hypothetical protein
MIIPIHGLKYHQFKQPIIGEEVTLLKEKDNIYDSMAIAAYNRSNQQIGYIGAKNQYNKKVYSKMLSESTIGVVWAIFPNQILVELDFKKKMP